jgi:hypothetical protein
MMHAGIDYLIRRNASDGAPYIAEWNGVDPKPTQEQLDSAFSKVAGKTYVELRKAEYPDIGDQLDAAYKARRGEPEEQGEMDARITDIKMKYPKPGVC